MSEYQDGPQPSVAEVTDRRPAVRPIGINVLDPVRTAPAKYSRMRTLSLGAGAANAVPAIDFDPRYRRVWVSCATANVWLGTASQLKGNTPDGFLLPFGVTPIPWEGFDEELTYAMAASGTATLSLRFEFWAD